MMTPQEDIRIIIRQTVSETLVGLGFDVHEPKNLQADMIYLRKIRKGGEDMVRRVRASAITLIVSTTLFLIWQAIKDNLGRGS